MKPYIHVVLKDEEIVMPMKVRTPSYASTPFELGFTGNKSSVHSHSNYLVIVTPPFFPTFASQSATVRNLVARSPNAGETDITKVTVFDPENKLVAYSGTFKQGVREVISQWGNTYVLSTDGNVSSNEQRT